MADATKLKAFIEPLWDSSVFPTIEEYIRIPNQYVPSSAELMTSVSQFLRSPIFDPEWKTNGYMEKCCNLLVDWVKVQNVPGLKLEVPLLLATPQALTLCR